MSNTKELIFCAYAYEENMRSGENIGPVKDKKIMYLKDATVALVSAKLNNPDADVALISNIDIPEPFKSKLDHYGVMVRKEPFDTFKFDASYKWGCAFYKLCAYKKVLTYGYDHYLMIDTDVYVQNSLEDLWEETEDYLLIHDHIHRASNGNAKLFAEETKKFCGISRILPNYAGGFVAGNRKNMEIFIGHCDDIYRKMIEDHFVTRIGDEFILRLAADHMRDVVKNANAYIENYYTICVFHYVSTHHIYNPVSVLHLPNEKQYGLFKVYDYLDRYGKLPENKKLYRMLNLHHLPFDRIAKYHLIKLLKRQ